MEFDSDQPELVPIRDRHEALELTEEFACFGDPKE
jgi:hypothetical protein